MEWWFKAPTLSLKNTPCIVWSGWTQQHMLKASSCHKVFTNTFFQHDILHGCTTWPSIILLTVASKPLQHLITVSVGEQETTINIQLLRRGKELNNCTIRVIEAVKAGSQYVAGAASVVSIVSVTGKTFLMLIFLTIWLVGCWLTIVMQCWNSNQVYSSITPTFAMLRWHGHHIVNQVYHHKWNKSSKAYLQTPWTIVEHYFHS